MANFYGQGRSNLFAVKDAKAFKQEMAGYPVEVFNEGDLYGIMDANQDGAGLEWSYYDHDTDEEIEVDWVAVLAKHLAEDSVAVLMEIGSEKYRYFQGYAVAVNSKGETKAVNLSDIFKLAEELGKNVTTF